MQKKVQRADRRLIMINNREIAYNLQRKMIKNINLRIKPDGSVNISAPHRVPLAEIEDFMLSKGSFILNAIEKSEQQRQNHVRPRYIDGEIIYFLGKPYKMVIREGARIKVSISDDEIIMQIPDISNIYARVDIMKKWYKRQAQAVFDKTVKNVYLKYIKYYDVPYPKITIREMKSRWGSCRPDVAKITLNTLLITAPIEELEYVVIHEFAHLIQPNHSREFWKIVEQFEPRYKELRYRLRDINIQAI